MIGTIRIAGQLLILTVGLSLSLAASAHAWGVAKEMCRRDRAILCGPKVPKGLCHLEDHVDQLSPACKGRLLGKAQQKNGKQANTGQKKK